MRGLNLAIGALALTGCSSLTTMYGARTLEPGTIEINHAISVGAGVDPFQSSITSAVLGVPANGHYEVAGRYGVIPDLDVGWRAGTGGLGGDVRYRFFRSGRLHLATAAGLMFSGFSLGNAETGRLSQFGIELRTPLLAEVDLTRSWSVSASAQLVTRALLTSADVSVLSGSSNRVDLVGTAGLRTEHRFNRMALAGAFDLVNEPLRATPFGWQASVQIIIRTDAAARAARRAKRPIRYEEAP
jgi:hypothetical protein